MKLPWLLWVAFSWPAACTGPDTSARLTPPEPPEKVKGLSFVAPPRPFPDDPMPAVRSAGAGWIAVIPYAYTRAGEPAVHYNRSDWQWWGERPAGCRRTIELAKANGLRVMLKPQVYVPRSWTGALEFPDEAGWEKWEADYEAYILPMAGIAQEFEVEMLCIGTEFKLSVQLREAFWRELIRKIRDRYNGQLVYAANWDEYPLVPFWDALDYIGVNAYFPLVDTPTPEVDELTAAWKPYADNLRAFSQQWKKPILFTEFGYLSVDGCAGKTWELEARIRTLNVNEQAQANALQACFSTFWKQSFWAGGFLWKWFPHMQGHEGYPAKDYTPQDKAAETILKQWYEGKRTGQ